MTKKFDISDKKLWQTILREISKVRTLLAGIIVMVGSVGLLLGALTCAVASIAVVYYNVELVPAMLIGFFSVGIVSLLVGFALIAKGIPK